MKKISLAYAVSGIFLLDIFGCRTSQSQEAEILSQTQNPQATVISVDGATKIPATKCEFGDLSTFMLSLPNPQINSTDLQLPQNELTHSPVELREISPDNNIRLDVCISADSKTATLRQIVFMGSLTEGSATFSYLTLPTPSPDPELANVLFSTPGRVDLRIPYFQREDAHQTTQFSFHLASWSVKNQLIVSISKEVQKFDLQGKQVGPTSALIAMGGVLQPGDPIVDNPDKLEKCPNTGRPSKKVTFKIQTAKFDFQICFAPFGTAGTTEYKIIAAAVTDDHPKLNPQVRGKTITIADEDFQKLFNYRVNHHNVCDSFALHLPHATYAATGAPFGEARQGCDANQVVPDAPTRILEDQSNSFYFRVKYGDEPWQQFVEPCGKSYMKDCQA